MGELFNLCYALLGMQAGTEGASFTLHGSCRLKISELRMSPSSECGPSLVAPATAAYAAGVATSTVAVTTNSLWSLRQSACQSFQIRETSLGAAVGRSARVCRPRRQPPAASACGTSLAPLPAEAPAGCGKQAGRHHGGMGLTHLELVLPWRRVAARPWGPAGAWRAKCCCLTSLHQHQLCSRSVPAR
jgi:hypothetical protein